MHYYTNKNCQCKEDVTFNNISIQNFSGPKLYERETHTVNYEQYGARPPIHLRLHPHHKLPAEFCEKVTFVVSYLPSCSSRKTSCLLLN